MKALSHATVRGRPRSLNDRYTPGLQRSPRTQRRGALSLSPRSEWHATSGSATTSVASPSAGSPISLSPTLALFEHKRADFHLLPGILSTQTSYPIIRMSRNAIKHRLSPLSFLICIRRKLRLPIYPPNTRCTCGHHDHDVFGDHAFCCDKGSKKCTHNTIATDFATILSPALAQAGYIYPNTKLDIETHLHLRSDPTA